MNFIPLAPALQVAVLAVVSAIAILAWMTAVPSHHISPERRRAGAQVNPTVLARSTAVATGAISSVLNSRGQTDRFANMLDRAGIRRDPADFLLMTGAGAVVGLALGMVVGGPVVGVLLAFFALAGSYMRVSFRADKRKGDFSDQLDDLLQLLASNLRAGHSILQAMNSVAHELDEPGASEIMRVVNQVRVGRDLGESLNEAAERMDSDDFRWVSQAIAIHRQVGGNLADVLDGVSETIRERGQIKRQVKALAAEGKLSAWILLALPFVVIGLLALMNPTYIGTLFTHPLGYAMIGAGVVSLTIGALWLRKVVQVKF